MTIHLPHPSDGELTKCKKLKNPDVGKIFISNIITEVNCSKCLEINTGRRIGKVDEICSNKTNCRCKICRLRDIIKRKYLNDTFNHIKRDAAKKLAEEFIDQYVNGWSNRKEFNKFFQLVKLKITKDMISGRRP